LDQCDRTFELMQARSVELATRQTHSGMLMALIAMTTVGGAVTSSVYLRDYPAFTTQAVRYGLTAVSLLVVSTMLRRRSGASSGGRWLVQRPCGTEWLWLAAAAITGQAIYNLALIAALRSAEPAAIGALLAAVPIVLAIGAPLARGQRPGGSLVFAALIVTAGAVIVNGSGAASWRGVVFGLVALMGEAAFTLLAAPVLRRLGPMSVALHTSWMAAAMLTICALGFDSLATLPAPSRSVILATLYLVAASGLAFALWFAAVDLVGGELAGLAAGIIPIAAAVTGWVWA
jgi:drug/metabolite transporter (DMT)-like permease